MTNSDGKSLVAIAGASGFVGTSLRIALADRYRWRALTRSRFIASRTTEDSTEWHHCDLYSLPQVEQALTGAQIGVYLVHSMMPSSRLVQASFKDMDLLLADNFIRAAQAAGLEHIIYLGGLLPQDTGHLSDHLASRLEVERVLKSRDIPVTVLRAGLILGPGGSSMRMLVNLVRRLPFMILPAWTRSRTQSVDIRRIVEGIDLAMAEPRFRGGTYDLASHPPTTYREMIEETATVMERKPLKIPFPANSFSLSSLWVALVGGVSTQLVTPLLDSLRHDLEARPNPLLEALEERTPSRSFADSVRDSIDQDGRPLPNPRTSSLQVDRRHIREERRVRSIQRMPLPEGWEVGQVADAYGHWLTRRFYRIIQVDRDEDGIIRFHLTFPRRVLLELTPTPFSRGLQRRRAFYISGGLLVRQVDPPGRFEFRVFPESGVVIAAIHGFAPKIPWQVYSLTQAPVHLFVMRGFSRYLAHQRKA